MKTSFSSEQGAAWTMLLLLALTQKTQALPALSTSVEAAHSITTTSETTSTSAVSVSMASTSISSTFSTLPKQTTQPQVQHPEQQQGQESQEQFSPEMESPLDLRIPNTKHTPLSSQHQQHLFARQQSEGSSCSSEGQWNCMTNSWQRCASGKWSTVMDCALGTICTPSGLTDDFKVEFDPNYTGGSGGGVSGGSGGMSLGPRGSVDRLILGMVCGLWALAMMV